MVFEVVDENLNRIGTTTNASELHGMLAGLVCAGVDEDDIDNWLPVLCFEDRYVTEDEYRMFEHDVRGFYREVLKQLDEFGVEFNILLPEERNSSTDRIVAMTSWCTGYLKALIDYEKFQSSSCPRNASNSSTTSGRFRSLIRNRNQLKKKWNRHS